MLSGKRIILGVTGGIAAYKSAALLRDFQKAGADVRVIMTPDATRFVGSDTFAALSRNEVPVRIFPKDHSGTSEHWVKHIQWAEWADIMVIAPCTANTLAKLAHGFADNMLSAVVLAARCPVMLCPTMDGEMYHAAVTKKNLSEAKSLGFHITEPESGYLASGLNDAGRLPENSVILNDVSNILSSTSGCALSGKNVLVTAGPTREFIDPVRFISNPSSGKMGIAMAKAARNLGANVTLLHGDIHPSLIPSDIATHAFDSADELFELIKSHSSDQDVIIMAAAVSDYKPAQTSDQKIKKKDSEESLTFTRTPDSLAWLGEHKTDTQTLIGFAMETDNLEQNAREKISKKNLDWIVANTLNDTDSGFRHDSNNMLLLSSDGDKKSLSGLKTDLARDILNTVFSC